jgi:hypothetical protein
MTQINASTLAQKLQVTPGRVSQYVAEGKLDGCYSGTGRARRFDLGKCVEALGRKLDRGQMLGNGAETRRALDAVQAGKGDTKAATAAPKEPAAGASELPQKDPDRYEMARTQKAEEEARRLRRQNAEAEGTYVLASEVERQVAKVMAQEIAEVDSVLREGARKVADSLGVDYKSVRQLLTETWRAHRSGRADVLEKFAQEASKTAAELNEDI